MKRWGAVGALLVMVLAATSAQAAPAAPLVVSGIGGQTAALTVPAGGVEIEYPFVTQSRLTGPDGTIGGVAIQRAGDGRLVGGTLLLNAPGFDGAIGVELVAFGRTRLPQGRYRITLLGSQRQEVRLTLRGQTRARQLRATGRPAPITRTVARTTRAVDSWSDDLGRTGGSDYLLIGAGAGGDLQQAETADLCLRPTSAAAAPCVPGGGWFITPGAGGSGAWSMQLYPPGSLERGLYTFSGTAVGAGPSSLTGHAGIVISLRR